MDWRLDHCEKAGGKYGWELGLIMLYLENMGYAESVGFTLNVVVRVTFAFLGEVRAR